MADVPVALDSQIEATPEGLRYRTELRSLEAMAGLTAFGWTIAAVLIIPSFLLLIFNPACCIFIFFGIAVAIAAPLLGAVMTKEVWVDITPEGIRQNTLGGVQMTWKHVDQLVLTGDVRRRGASLKAGSFEIYSWKAIKVETERGWDVERIRWFAQQVAEMSGLELEDGLPAMGDFEERRAEKKEEARQRRILKRARIIEKNLERFPELHEIAAEPVKTREIEEGVAYVLDQGQRHFSSKQTSTTEEQPVYLAGNLLIVGKRCEKLADFEAFYIWFEKSEKRTSVLLGGALRNGQSWKIARRESEAAAQIRGVVEDLQARLIP